MIYTEDPNKHPKEDSITEDPEENSVTKDPKEDPISEDLKEDPFICKKHEQNSHN